MLGAGLDAFAQIMTAALDRAQLAIANGKDRRLDTQAVMKLPNTLESLSLPQHLRASDQK